MNVLLTTVLEAGVNSGFLRPIDTGLVASALVMIFLQVPYRELMVRGSAEIDVDAFSGEIVSLVMSGVLSENRPSPRG